MNKFLDLLKIAEVRCAVIICFNLMELMMGIDKVVKKHLEILLTK